MTTQSSDLLDALTAKAESVVLCERQDAVTTLRHLRPADIHALAEFDGLGAMWMSGRLGVTP